MACAQIFLGPEHPFTKITKATPDELSDDEVLVKINLATVCGSDLHTLAGKREEKTPCILGHEAVGQVVASGKNRQEWQPGERVTWSIANSCGKCQECQEYNLPQKCRYLFKYGHAELKDGSGLNGCYASHILLRGGTHIVSVPDQLDDAVVAPVNCALATAVNAVAKLPTPCKSALVQGAGLLGQYTCGLLHNMDIERVYCFDRLSKRRNYSSKFGAIPIESSNELNSLEPNGVDVVFEVSGSSEMVSDGLSAIRPGGYYIFVGMVHPNSILPITGEQIIRKCLQIRGVHNYGPKHLDDALNFLINTVNKYPFADLVGSITSLSALSKAVQLARTNQFFRVGVRP